MYFGNLKILPGKMLFSSNKASVGGAIVISKSNMSCHFEAYIVFSRNKAKNGGAISIYKLSIAPLLSREPQNSLTTQGDLVEPFMQ